MTAQQMWDIFIGRASLSTENMTTQIIWAVLDPWKITRTKWRSLKQISLNYKKKDFQIEEPKYSLWIFSHFYSLHKQEKVQLRRKRKWKSLPGMWNNLTCLVCWTTQIYILYQKINNVQHGIWRDKSWIRDKCPRMKRRRRDAWREPFFFLSLQQRIRGNTEPVRGRSLTYKE